MSYEDVSCKMEGDSLSITLMGDPVVWSAPTFSKNGAYDKKWKFKRDACLLLKELKVNTLTCPLRMIGIFYTPMPKSWSKKKRALMGGNVNSSHSGDLTNFEKLVEDVLQKAEIIKDDCQIAIHVTVKVWSETGKTKLTLQPITENNDTFAAAVARIYNS